MLTITAYVLHILDFIYFHTKKLKGPNIHIVLLEVILNVYINLRRTDNILDHVMRNMLCLYLLIFILNTFFLIFS